MFKQVRGVSASSLGPLTASEARERMGMNVSFQKQAGPNLKHGATYMPSGGIVKGDEARIGGKRASILQQQAK